MDRQVDRQTRTTPEQAAETRIIETRREEDNALQALGRGEGEEGRGLVPLTWLGLAPGLPFCPSVPPVPENLDPCHSAPKRHAAPVD